jgi:hypothetical protein
MIPVEIECPECGAKSSLLVAGSKYAIYECPAGHETKVETEVNNGQ